MHGANRLLSESTLILCALRNWPDGRQTLGDFTRLRNISKPMVFAGIEAALRTGSRGERGGYWLEPAFDGVAAWFEQPLIQCVRGRHGTAFKLLLRKGKGRMDCGGGPLAIITFLRGRLDGRRPPLPQSHLRFVALRRYYTATVSIRFSPCSRAR